MTDLLEAELAATCNSLGHQLKEEYYIEPTCYESVKDLIKFLKRDNESHTIRRSLGKSKVLQNDLINIVKACSSKKPELFDVTLRLLINLTTPTMVIYGEEIPKDLIKRNIYLSLISYEQEYKNAFCDVEFWNHMCGKLTNLFETDSSERSVDDGIQIERILMLLRNVLQVPADVENENRPENDITIHDKVLWALRQSQILELLLFVSSNKNEEQYYLNLLEIFSLILREQNPKVLASCNPHETSAERNEETEKLIKRRTMERNNQNKYLNMRNFNTTFVMKGIKTLSSNDIVCHRPLDKVYNMDVGNLNNRPVKKVKTKTPVENDRLERRSTFSVRLFLKEFCTEFLNYSFNHLMNAVKNRLDSGKTFFHDQSYYFWALHFFIDYAVATNSDIDTIKDFLSSSIFHFVQTSLDNAFEHLQAEKKKTVEWVKRIHLILKAYRSLLESLWWMDCSKNPLVRSISRKIKSEIFYVVEYREMALNILLKYDSTKFPLSYLKDLIETTHLFIKLLEEFSKQTKLVVQKLMRKKLSKKKEKKKEKVVVETKEEKWEKIKDDTYDILVCESCFPEIPPFDAASDVPIDDQKGKAMKKIQKFLFQGKIRDAIGLLRSARQVWPENDYFGSDGMTIEDETMALQEICLADLKNVEGSDGENELAVTVVEEPEDKPADNKEEDPEENEMEPEEESRVVEQDFNIMEYKKRLVNKKVIQGCGILLKNYKENSDFANHCVIKLLHRIGWECCVPAMLYQASLFWTLLKIMKEKDKRYDEINTFTINLVRKFRKDASKNPVVFLELLFWKAHNVAMEIQHGYEVYEEKQKPKRAKKKKQKKSKNPWIGDESSEEEQMELEGSEIVETISESVEKKPKKEKQSKRTKSKDKVKNTKNKKKERVKNGNLIEDTNQETVKEDNAGGSSEKDVAEGLSWGSSDEDSKRKSEGMNLNESKENKERVDGDGLSSSKQLSLESPIKDESNEGEPKKRDRDDDESQDSDKFILSKSKRRRCIGSDSESDHLESEDDLVRITKGKRKFAVIDSDSDAEPFEGVLPNDSSHD